MDQPGQSTAFSWLYFLHQQSVDLNVDSINSPAELKNEIGRFDQFRKRDFRLVPLQAWIFADVDVPAFLTTRGSPPETPTSTEIPRS